MLAVWNTWGVVSRENSNKKQDRVDHWIEECPPKVNAKIYLKMTE